MFGAVSFDQPIGGVFNLNFSEKIRAEWKHSPTNGLVKGSLSITL